MRKLLMTGTMFLLVMGVYAQKNNPFNERGVQYVESLEIIRADLEAGKVKDFNEESIRHYASSLPFQTEASVETVTQILATLKDPGFNFDEQLERTNLSDFAKKFLRDMLPNSQFSKEEYQQSLIRSVDVVRHSDIDDEEKEMLLTQVAIGYNIMETNSWDGSDCWLTINGLTPPTRESCAFAGALAGGIVGTMLCGWICGGIGAVVGGIAGYLS